MFCLNSLLSTALTKTGIPQIISNILALQSNNFQNHKTKTLQVQPYLSSCSEINYKQ